MPETQKLNLNAGELSDELAGRIDLPKFNSGCEILENARVLRAGGVTRRAGFQFVGATVDETKKTRLLGFRFSEAQGYVVELGDHTMRIIHGGEIQPTVYATPWGEDKIFALQFAQRIDRIIVTHPDIPVHNIVRFSDDTWEVSEFPWQERIWELFPSTEEVIMTPGGLTGDTTINSSIPLFEDTWVGDRIRIDHVVGESRNEHLVETATSSRENFSPQNGNYATGDTIFQRISDTDFYYVAVQEYAGASDYVVGQDNLEDYPQFFAQTLELVPPTAVEEGWVFETFGTWTGVYWVQRSLNEGVSWDTIRVVSSDDNRNERVAETEESPALIRVIIPQYGPQRAFRVELTINSYAASGHALVTAVNSSTEVAVTVESPFQSLQSSSQWYEDAFSPRNGYAVGVTFYQGRLCFGGTEKRPQTLWLSRTQKPFDFALGTLATDGMSFQTDAEGYEAITWLSSHLSLLVGTTLGVWAISSPDGSTITPENNGINRQMQIGAQQGFQASPVQNNVLFLQYKGRKIQELTGGSVEYGGYLSADLTQLATHVTRGGVTQMVTGELPDSTLFLVSGGEIPLLTYERAQNVVGWARWKTDGAFESFATTSGDGEDDDHYAVVKRNGRRFIEYLAPDMLRIEEANDVRNLRFLDCYTEKVSEEVFSTVEGLERFDGMDIDTFIDGEPHGLAPVIGGVVQLPRSGKNVMVGLPYTTEVRPKSLDFGAIGSKSSISEVLVRFRNTLGGEVSQDRENWSEIQQQHPRTTGGDPLPLLSEDFQSTPHSTWERKPSISIRQNQPLPMTILAMRIKTKSSK